MLPTFVWSVPVKEKNGRGVTVLICTIHFHRHVYVFILVQWCFVKWKESFKCCLQRKMDMYAKYSIFTKYTVSLNKTICSSSVCSGGVSLHIQIYHLTLVEFNYMYCYYINFTPTASVPWQGTMLRSCIYYCFCLVVSILMN